MIVSASNTSNPQYLTFLALTSNGLVDRITYTDSMASQYFFTDQSDFVMYGLLDEACKKGLAANGSFNIIGYERMHKWVRFGGEITEIMFNNALHAPGLDYNLVLIGSLVRKGICLGIDRDGAMFYAPDG